MKKNLFPRILSVALALVMLTLCLPFSLLASAAGEVTPGAPEELSDLEAYRHASVQTKDNTVGLTVNVHTYYDESKQYIVSKQGVEETPVIFYVMNTNTERVGTKSDKEIVASLLDRDFFVIVLDYQNSEDAVSPALDRSVQDIRSQVIGGQNFAGNKTYTAGTYTDGKLTGAASDSAIAYVLPAGYDIAYRIPYFSYDKHGAAGVLEKIVEVWNNDFKSVHRAKLVKWTDEDGTPLLGKTEAITKASANDKSGITDYAVWFKDENKSSPISQAALEALSPEEQKAYPYTYIGNTKAESVTDCKKPDGSFVDLNLYLDVFYPTGSVDDVPVMVCMASTYTRAAMLSTPTRPQMTGFLFSGYAGVVSDYGLVPMCRNDHYGYFCGNSQANSVSGDNTTYSLAVYSGIKSDSAMLRTVRKLGVDGLSVEGFSQTLKFPLNPDKIGIYGNSKSGYCIRFANPNPEKLEELYHFEGHLGESRLEAKNNASYGYTDPYLNGDETTDVRIALPEEQPVLTYADGTTIPSGANLVYAQCGADYQVLAKGSAPVFGTGTQKAGGDGCSYWTFYTHVLNRCRNLDIPFFGLVSPDVGHNFGYGEDQSYGIDTYYAFHRYANYWLKDKNAECVVIDVDTKDDIGTDNQKAIDNIYEIGKDSSIKLAFTGPVGGEEIAKVQIVDAVTGEGVVGIWHGSYGDQQWKFLPTDIKDGTYYRVIVPDTILAKNGKPLKEVKSLTFRTESGVTVPASAAGGDATVTDTDASFVTFDPDTIRTAHRIDLRFTVENDASNTVVISGASLAAGETYESVTAWETLGEVVLTGAGTYSFDVTSFVRACAGTPAFRLQAKEEAKSVKIKEWNMENGSSSGLWFTGTVKTSVSSEAKNADGSDNKSLKIDYILRTSRFIDLDNNLCGNYITNPTWLGTVNYWLNSENKATEQDFGRAFRLSFRIHDETSRLVSISIGSEVHSASKTVDPNNYSTSFYTKADEWTPVTLEFRFDDPADYADFLNKAQIHLMMENKSIATLNPLAAVNATEMAKSGSTRPSNYAGSVGLNDSYTHYGNVTEAEAAGVVTVNRTLSKAVYFDDIVFEEFHTSVALAASPVLAVKPMEEKDTLPVKATYVSSSNPDLSGEGDTLLVGGGERGTDKLSVKSYVQLSLDGYTGKTAALLFRASGKNSGIAVYGVANVAAGESWDSADITAATAPANDRYSSGVDLSAVWGGAPLATFTVNGEGQEFALDLTDFASEMYLAGATAVTLIFVSTSAEGVNEVASLDFTTNYPLQEPAYQDYAKKRHSRETDADGNSVLNIYPEATVNEDHTIHIGNVGNSLFPNFTTEHIGNTYRVTIRVKANTTGVFEVGMFSPKPRTSPVTKTDGTTDTADEKPHTYIPYLPVKECTITEADVWQTFTYEFTVDAYMAVKRVNNWGSETDTSINVLGIRTYKMNPYKDKTGAEKVARATELQDADASTLVVLSIDNIEVEEIAGNTTIELVDKAKGTLVSAKGYGEASLSGYSNESVNVKKDFVSSGNGKPVEIKLGVERDRQDANPNQAVLINGLINGWRCNLFAAANVGKTYRITFTASATEAGRLDFGLLTMWVSGNKVYNITDGVKSENLREVFYPGTASSVQLTSKARTYSLEFTLTEGMLSENLLKEDGTASGSTLAPAFKFYNGFRDEAKKYKDVTITLDNFLVYEVEKSAYAGVDTVNTVADFESDTYGPSYYYFETRYMTEDAEKPEFRDSFGRVASEAGKEAHSGSYMTEFKSTRVNNFPYWTRLLPTSYTEAERGNTYAVSFYMKATKTGQFKVALTCAYGGSYYNLSNLHQAETFTVTEAGVWQKYTYTYTVGDAQLQADKSAIYLAIHPFAMNQSSEWKELGEKPGDKRLFVSEDPVYMYFDDFSIRRTPSALTETNLAVAEKAAVSEAGTSEKLTVTAAPSIENANIKRTYLTFAPYDGAELYEVALRLNLTKAAGQTVKVYALYGAMPDTLTFATAPALAGKPVATFTAAVGEMRIDVTSAILAAGGKAVTFVLVVDEGGEDVSIEYGTNTPRLTYGVAESSDFDPSELKVKANITLYSDFCYNLYVRALNEVKEITLDGTSLSLFDLDKVEVDGQEYYRVSKKLVAKDAAGSFRLCVTLSDGGTVRNASYTLSIPSYAKKLIDGTQTDETKALAKDMLSYISAATVYFGTASEETKATIASVIGDYDGAIKPDQLPDAVQETSGLTGARLELDATPSFLFYIDDEGTADSFRFSCDNAPLTFTKERGADGRVYFKVTTYAYGMRKAIRYTYTDASGKVQSGAYNLTAYHNGTSDATRALVLALAGYSVSAENYRKSVIR